MGWIYIESKTACPCGKGFVTQVCRSDDDSMWVKDEYFPVEIECEECSKKYRVDTACVFNYHEPYSDCYEHIHYLIPRNYPCYNGPSEEKMYGRRSDSSNFSAWLIENFTEQELKEVMDQLNSVKASSKLVGKGADICMEHRKTLHTVKISNIQASVEKAIEAYPNYVGNKLQRKEIADKEYAARCLYEKEKRKYRIRINLP